MKMPGAKGPCVREYLDRLQPIGFSLTVIAVKNIDSSGAIDPASEVAEAIDGN